MVSSSIKLVGRDILASGIVSISEPGHTLLLGLFDAHDHALGVVPVLEQALRFGVTTLLDMHNVPSEVAKLKEAARERKDVADTRRAGYSATIDGEWPASAVKKYATGERSVSNVLHRQG